MIGAIINIGSVVAFAPYFPFGIYGATKAYVLALSQNMQAELGPRGVYVQLVLPATTRTEVWQPSGRDVNKLPGVMEADENVDAALVGFDRQELVTIPPLHDVALWQAYEDPRKAMLPHFSEAHAAKRYSS